MNESNQQFEQFAKIFYSEKYGQIVLMKDDNSEGNPAVVCYVRPEQLGTCSIAIGFSDDDAGYDSRDKAFENANEELALKMAGRVFDALEEQP